MVHLLNKYSFALNSINLSFLKAVSNGACTYTVYRTCIWYVPDDPYNVCVLYSQSLFLGAEPKFSIAS